MKVNSALVSFSPYELLQKLLEKLNGGYTIEQFETSENEPERFAINIGSEQVAVATFDINSSDFGFEFSDDIASKRLEGQLIVSYSKGLHWIVLYYWHGEWSYSGDPKPTAEMALQDVEDIAFMAGPQPELVVFRPAEWHKEALVVLHSFVIHGASKKTCRRGEVPSGGKAFILTIKE